MLDSNLMLIKSTEAVVVANSPITGTSKLIGPSPVPETWMTYVPSVSNTTTPVLTVTIEESDDDSNWVVISTRAINVAGCYYDTVMSNCKYRRAVLTITGTLAAFGLVLVGRVPAGHYDNW